MFSVFLRKGMWKSKFFQWYTLQNQNWCHTDMSHDKSHLNIPWSIPRSINLFAAWGLYLMASEASLGKSCGSVGWHATLTLPCLTYSSTLAVMWWTPPLWPWQGERLRHTQLTPTLESAFMQICPVIIQRSRKQWRQFARCFLKNGLIIHFFSQHLSFLFGQSSGRPLGIR